MEEIRDSKIIHCDVPRRDRDNGKFPHRTANFIQRET
jgi:hypothetical protein